MSEGFLRKCWQTNFTKDSGMLKQNILFAKLYFSLKHMLPSNKPGCHTCLAIGA